MKSNFASTLVKKSIVFAIAILSMSPLVDSTARTQTLRTVALTGEVAPGTTDNFTVFGDFALNGAGQTAFYARLDTGNSTTENGIWAEDLSGLLALIVREGDLPDVEDGPDTDFRTISTLSFLSGLSPGTKLANRAASTT